jgi:parallel beta-helix repeat protein
MIPTIHLAAGGLALGLVAAGWTSPVSAADCGDTAGPGGTRVECLCGDSVVTDTLLNPDDAVVSEQCGEVGLVITSPGITLDCDGLALRGTTSVDLTGAGVVMAADGSVVQRCTVSGFDSGIRANQGLRGNQIRGNTVVDNLLFGIALNSSSQSHRVIDNLAEDNGEVGIQINSASYDIHVIGNVASGHPIAGIQFNSEARQNQILLNQVTGEGERGIQFNSSAELNFVGSNTVDGGDLGINFNSGALSNAVIGNAITGTVLAAVRFNEGGQSNRVTQNLLSDNRGEGVRIEEEATGNLLASNLVFGNDDDGIEVCGVDNDVDSNDAWFNGEWDICAAAGNIDARNNAGEVTFECPIPPDCEPLL